MVTMKRCVTLTLFRIIVIWTLILLVISEWSTMEVTGEIVLFSYLASALLGIAISSLTGEFNE